MMNAETVAITNLLKLERYYRDTGQWALCRAAFHPDAALTYINVAWYEGDVEDFLLQSMRSHQGKVNILHSAFDPVQIRIHGDRAVSEGFCLITSMIAIDGIDYELASYVRLVSRMQKLQNKDEWRILSLEAIYIRDRLVVAFAGANPSKPLALSEEVLAYPKAYRHLAFVMMHRGLRPRLGLPHEDNSDSVQEVLDKNNRWLHGTENGKEDQSLDRKWIASELE